MLFNTLRFVLDQFWQRKLRFSLTVSGIVVGVASLAVLASFITVGQDVLKATNNRASGDDLMTISNDWRAQDKYPQERRLAREDNERLSNSVTLNNVDFAPQYGLRGKSYLFRGKDDDAFIVGLDARGFVANDLKVTQGRGFLSQEYSDYSRVAIIGGTLLEGHKPPFVGETIRVDNYNLRIVGVLQEKPTMGPGKRFSWNSRIILPAETFNVLFNPERKPESIIARVSPSSPQTPLNESMKAAQSLVMRVLMLEREYDIFRISGAEDRDSNENTILFVIKLLMYMTTFFSMLVGGINVMNIMLVTVTERTREIGIRRALGATRANIMGQFLMESIFITLTGGVVGLLLSLGGLKLLSELLTRVYYPWPFYIAWWSVGLGIGLTVVIGAIFGLSPAMKAARLDPVEALRFD
ncbi:MAG: ABC transporter permease [Myxococcota bacterium]